MPSAPHNDRQAKIAAAADRPKNTKAILGAVIGALVVLGIVLAIWLPNRGGDTPAAPGTTGTATGASGTGTGTAGNAAVKLPKGVKDANSPVIATNGGVLKDGIPTLQIFEDFQCPACKQAEEIFGGRIHDLAAAGKINVVYYIKTFLDDNLRNDSSKKAGNAALCAADAGKFAEFHDKVYAKQPTNEGDGYTDEALASAATEAGISGAALDTWKKCAADRPYVPYLKGLEEYTYRVMDVRGTPYFFVNNKVISLSGVATADDFEKKLFEVAK